MIIKKSQQDQTVKYIYKEGNFYNEFSYIDNGTNKDIICVPCQTSCNMNCKFCFLTYIDLPVKNLTSDFIVNKVSNIISYERKHDTLLVSYMGCGEPLNNLSNVINSMLLIRKIFTNKYKVVRFGLATIMPSQTVMLKLIDMVSQNNLPVKLHLSLHSVDKESRKILIPRAIEIEKSISLLNLFRKKTGNSIEAHYSLIKNISDQDEQISRLIELVQEYNVPIKFLKYNENKNETLEGTNKDKIFRIMQKFSDLGLFSEYYEPPGIDIGASCGQFLKEYYNKEKKCHLN